MENKNNGGSVSFCAEKLMNRTYFSIEGLIDSASFKAIQGKMADFDFNGESFEEFGKIGEDNVKTRFLISGNEWAYNAVEQFADAFADCLKKTGVGEVYRCKVSDDYGDETWIISKRGVRNCDVESFIKSEMEKEKAMVFVAKNMSPVEEEIVSTIVEKGLALGWEFTEGDVDSPQIKRSRDFREIMEACDSVEQITLRMHSNNENHWVSLVFNGDETVVADYDGLFDKRYDEWVKPIVDRAEREAMAQTDAQPAQA